MSGIFGPIPALPNPLPTPSSTPLQSQLRGSNRSSPCQNQRQSPLNQLTIRYLLFILLQQIPSFIYSNSNKNKFTSGTIFGLDPIEHKLYHGE
jgi:hypothetical protein